MPTSAMEIPLTPELREKMREITDQIIDLLQANFDPMEAYSLLHMLIASMRNTYGIQDIQLVELNKKVN